MSDAVTTTTTTEGTSNDNESRVDLGGKSKSDPYAHIRGSGWDDDDSEVDGSDGEDSEESASPEQRDDDNSKPPMAKPTPKDKGAEDKGKKPEEPQAKAKDAAEKEQYIDLDGKRVPLKEVKAVLQKAREVDERFRQVADARKSMEAFVLQLKSDPLSVLRDERLGVDLSSLTEALLRQRIDSELEDPKDREIRLRDEKLRKYEEQEKAHKERMEAAEREQVVNKRRQEIGKVFMDAVNATPFASSPELAGDVVREMAIHAKKLKAEGQDFDAKTLAEHVQSKYRKAFLSLLATMEGDSILDLIGEEGLRKVRKADLGKLKATQQTFEKPETSNAEDDKPWPSSKPSKPKFVDPRDARLLR